MAKITSVKSAGKRKEGRQRYRCYACRDEIQEGQAYSWVQPSRFSARINWHATCPTPPASAMESNEKRAQAMAAFEGGYDALDSIDIANFESDDLLDELRSIIEVIAEGVRESAEMWREAAQNIEDGFQHATYQSDELNERADEYDGIADAVDEIGYGLSDDRDVDNPDDETDEEWRERMVDEVRSSLEDVEDYP